MKITHVEWNRIRKHYGFITFTIKKDSDVRGYAVVLFFYGRDFDVYKAQLVPLPIGVTTVHGSAYTTSKPTTVKYYLFYNGEIVDRNTIKIE